MEDLLIEVLSEMFPVFQQGSMNPNEGYPDSYFTFWNNESPGDGFFDNNENSIIWDYDVNFYSSDPSKVYSVLMDAKRRLKDNGFVVSGGGHSVASDEPTHTGRGINVLYRQEL